MDFVRIMGSDQRENPILLTLVQKSGETMYKVRINCEVPTIKGFLAIENQDIKHSTKYIALDAIESFTVLDEEARNITSAFGN